MGSAAGRHAPEDDGKLYLTDVEIAGRRIAATAIWCRVKIQKTDSYDLVGRVVEIEDAIVSAAACAGSRRGAYRGLRRARRCA